jgi:hypothetical protein
MCEQIISITLNEVLRELEPPPQEVLTLPIAHLTTVSSFENIINNGGALQPSRCRVFDRELLYFSYGGVFHRHRQEPTQETDVLPVALLFRHTVLDRMDCFFPYDTGAAYHQRYAYWSQKLSQFDRYQIPNNETYQLLSKLIHYTYGGNQNYTRGRAILGENEPEPLITLLQFLNDDLTPYGVDHRKNSIECQTSSLIDLGEVFDDILWIGFPDEERCIRQFARLCRSIESECLPAYDTYGTHTVETPSALARVLQEVAYQRIIRPIYLNFG